MPNTQERDEVKFREPILKQAKVKVKISFAEPAEWKPKDPVKKAGGSDIRDSYKACKLTLNIVDPSSVRCEHPDALPKTTVDDQFNVQKYPYLDKDGEVAWLNREKLFSLETAFGFDPVFVDGAGNEVEPHITKTGNKVAPKVEGVARVLNPSFISAYFHPDMTVNPDNWIDKEILVDVDVEKSEQFGDKNIIKRYHRVSTI